MKSHVVAAMVTVFFLLCASMSRGGEVYRNPELGFTVTIPDGFEAFSAPEGSPTPSLLKFYKLKNSAPGADMTSGLTIAAFPKKLGRPPENEEEILKGAIESSPAGTDIRLERTKWKSHEILIIRSVMTNPYNGVKGVILCATVPLTPKAIMVHSIGSVRQEAETRKYLEQTLAGLEGKSNWDEPDIGGTLKRVGLWGMIICVPLWIFMRWLSRLSKCSSPQAEPTDRFPKP